MPVMVLVICVTSATVLVEFKSQINIMEKYLRENCKGRLGWKIRMIWTVAMIDQAILIKTEVLFSGVRKTCC